MNNTELPNGQVLVKKPWGQYTDIYRSDDVVFKRIDISPGEELSYQFHHVRDEFWYISSGHGILTLDGEENPVVVGDNFIIDKKTKHQIKNNGDSTLIIFEMQCGDCRENDIVRISDKYGRSTSRIRGV